MSFRLVPVPANPLGEEMLSKSEAGIGREKVKRRRAAAAGVPTPAFTAPKSQFIAY